MMIVMPALAKTQKRRDPLVATLIRRLELALTKYVADGIGAKSNMVHQENPHQACPQETCPPTDQERQHEREQHPEPVGTVDKDNDPVLQEMTAVDVAIGHTVLEEPANVGMKKPFKRTMWITLTISPRVMLDVCSRPIKHRTFHGHGAENEQDKLDDGMRLEAAMGEHAMDARLLTELDERVHYCQQCQVRPGDSLFPDQVNSKNSREEGHDNAYEHNSFEGDRMAKRKGLHEISLQKNSRLALVTLLER